MQPTATSADALSYPHQRDDNAAVNLARYEPPSAGDSAVGPVRAAVKRRADRKTGPRPAGGNFFSGEHSSALMIAA
jgi:putative transposase